MQVVGHERNWFVQIEFSRNSLVNTIFVLSSAKLTAIWVRRRLYLALYVFKQNCSLGFIVVFKKYFWFATYLVASAYKYF